jgi:hypothetical protein
MRYIFTFWEPQDTLPGYLQLCMQTWRKFLPEYEIVVLNYSNLDRWLGKDCYDASLYKNFSLPKQADAIRCAVLNRWGGVWLDTDTIVTSEKVHDLLKFEAGITLLGKHIGFITAHKDAAILRIWEKSIRLLIALYAFCQGEGYLAKKMKRWRLLSNGLERFDFLGYLPLKIPLKVASISATAFKSIDKIAVNALPELSIAREMDAGEKYINFYFSDASIESAINNGGILYLHNSWTPERYKLMSENEFLSQDIVLAKILRHLLL